MKKYSLEKDGQIDFFETFRIDYKNNDVLIDYTDGVWKGNLLEFKLIINNINKTLYQAIKYLSKMRIKGESIPANILLISLNDSIVYIFNSSDYFDEIHKIYFGASSKNNDSFVAKSKPIKLDYSNQKNALKLISILKEWNYMPIELDEYININAEKIDIDKGVKYVNKMPVEFKDKIFSDLLKNKKLIKKLKNNYDFKFWFLSKGNDWDDYD